MDVRPLNKSIFFIAAFLLFKCLGVGGKGDSGGMFWLQKIRREATEKCCRGWRKVRPVASPRCRQCTDRYCRAETEHCAGMSGD